MALVVRRHPTVDPDSTPRSRQRHTDYSAVGVRLLIMVIHYSAMATYYSAVGVRLLIHGDPLLSHGDWLLSRGCPATHS
jgi:hypothetical protein